MCPGLLTQLHRSNGSSYPNLECAISRYGGNAIEIKLVNLDYGKQRKRKFLELLLCFALYVSYCVLGVVSTMQKQPLVQYYLIDLLFALWYLHIGISIFSMIKSENLLYCPHFAMQLRTERFCSRFYNNFIPNANIYDVCMNECIENLDIHYILIVRTKGALFKQKPVIPIFNSLYPSIECLELIYRQLMKVMENN